MQTAKKSKVNWIFRIFVGLQVAVAMVVAYMHFSTTVYKGVVAETKQIPSGVLIDLDGRFPKQGMTLFVSRAMETYMFGHYHGWAAAGSTVIVSGPITIYKGRREIVISDTSQLKWFRPPRHPTAVLDGLVTESGDDSDVDYEPSASDYNLPLSTADWIMFVGVTVYILWYMAIVIKNFRNRQQVPTHDHSVMYLATATGVVRTQRQMPVQFQLTELTTERYQQSLAMAYHLKEEGQPMAFNRLHPEEQKVAGKLAKRYPVSPETRQAMKDGRIKGPQDPENPPIPPDELRQIQVAQDEDREHYPRSLGPPSPAQPATAHLAPSKD